MSRIPSESFPRPKCKPEEIMKSHFAEWSFERASKTENGTLIARYKCAFCTEHPPHGFFLSKPHGASLFTLIRPGMKLSDTMQDQLLERIARFPSEPIVLTEVFESYPTFLYSAANRRWEAVLMESNTPSPEMIATLAVAPA